MSPIKEKPSHNSSPNKELNQNFILCYVCPGLISLFIHLTFFLETVLICMFGKFFLQQVVLTYFETSSIIMQVWPRIRIGNRIEETEPK